MTDTINVVIAPYKHSALGSSTFLVRSQTKSLSSRALTRRSIVWSCFAKNRADNSPRRPSPVISLNSHWIRADEDCGNWYRSGDLDMEGWLCPSSYDISKKRRSNLYTQVKALRPHPRAQSRRAARIRICPSRLRRRLAASPSHSDFGSVGSAIA